MCVHLLAAALLAILSFGSLAIVLLMAPVAVIAFVSGPGGDGGLQSTAIRGRLCAASRHRGDACGDNCHGGGRASGNIHHLPSTGEKRRPELVAVPGTSLSSCLYCVVLPLLAVAAYIEVHITPRWCWLCTVASG